MNGLRSNRDASVEAAVWRSSGEAAETGEGDVRKRGAAGRRAVVGLAEAALVLGMRPEGAGWRRRVLRRLRAMERELGVKLCASRKGRSGRLVSPDGLRQVRPPAVRRVQQIEDLWASLEELEGRIARTEKLVRCRLPKGPLDPASRPLAWT